MPVGQFVQYSQARGVVNPGMSPTFIFVKKLVSENNPMGLGPSVQYQHTPGPGNVGMYSYDIVLVTPPNDNYCHRRRTLSVWISPVLWVSSTRLPTNDGFSPERFPERE